MFSFLLFWAFLSSSLGALTSTALAPVGVPLKEAALTYQLPAGWALKPAKAGSRSCWQAIGPDTSVHLQVCLWTDAGELGESFDEALAEWNLTGPGEDGPADVDLNGMEAVLAEVHHGDSDDALEGLLLVCSPAESVRVVVLGLYPDEHEAGEKLLREFIGSLQPASGGVSDGDDALGDESLDDEDATEDDDSLSGDF
jgi:hypothetical protein